MIGYGALPARGRRRVRRLWYVVLGWLLGSAARAAVAPERFTDRLEGVTVADIMDAEPVTIPADAAGRARLRGLLPALPGLGVVRGRRRRRPLRRLAHREPLRQAAEARRRDRPVRELVVPPARTARCATDAPLEALLGSEPLRRLGALMAVDARRPPARRRDARAGLARAAGADRAWRARAPVTGCGGPQDGADSELQVDPVGRSAALKPRGRRMPCRSGAAPWLASLARLVLARSAAEPIARGDSAAGRAPRHPARPHAERAVRLIDSPAMPAHDVLIIGAGLAGQRAALAAADAGATVAIMSKVHPVRSHSNAAAGGINAALNPDDSWESHAFDTVKGSDYLGDQDAIEIMCREAPGRGALARAPRASPSTATTRASSARAPSAAPPPPAPTTSPTSPARRCCTCSTSS